MKLLYCLTITLGVGAIAGFATVSNINGWYAGLAKPSFNPPNWVFGPVWTILYIMMGISLFLILKQPPSLYKSNSLILFFLQLFLNFSWSFIFFYFHKIGIAFVDIAALWIILLLTILSFSRLSKKAAWLLLPYISWVTFAFVLNGAIYKIN